MAPKKTGFGRREPRAGEPTNNQADISPEIETPHTTVRDSVQTLAAILDEVSNATLTQNDSILRDPEFDRMVRSFRTESVANAMLYRDDGPIQFSTFGHATPRNSINFTPHEILFLLTNDLLAIAVLDAQRNASGDWNVLLELRALDAAIHSGYLCAYFSSLLVHIEKNLFADILRKDQTAIDEAKAISGAATERYMSKLRHLAGRNSRYDEILNAKISKKEIFGAPDIPLAVSHPLDADTKLLNIYFNKELGREMAKRLGRYQAEGSWAAHQGTK